VKEASDGVEALAAFERDPECFDLVFTDLTMPGLGGVELVRGVRRVRADLPALLTSGFAGGLGEWMEALDPVVFLQKPYTHLELAERVREALSAGGAVQNKESTPPG
jgi:CheY-like chemotaxis protein